MEKDGIGIGFWLEKFGEIEIRFYPDGDIKDIDITPAQRVNIHRKMRSTTLRLLEAIEHQQKGDTIDDGD